MIRLSNEAEALLKEILDHENDKQYWGVKFDSFSVKEDAIRMLLTFKLFHRKTTHVMK